MFDQNQMRVGLSFEMSHIQDFVISSRVSESSNHSWVSFMNMLKETFQQTKAFYFLLLWSHMMEIKGKEIKVNPIFLNPTD